jgi:hypothetical protein
MTPDIPVVRIGKRWYDRLVQAHGLTEAQRNATALDLTVSRILER